MMQIFVFIAQSLGDVISLRIVAAKRLLLSQSQSGSSSTIQPATSARKSRNQSSSSSFYAAKLQIFVAVVVISAYKLWKRVLHILVGLSALDRLARQGAIALARTQNYNNSLARDAPAAASQISELTRKLRYNDWLCRRSIWRISNELYLSTALHEELDTIERFATTSSVMTASDLATSVTISLSRRKDISFESPGYVFLERHAVKSHILVKCFENEVGAACAQRADWLPSSSDISTTSSTIAEKSTTATSSHSPKSTTRFSSLEITSLSTSDMFVELWHAVHAAESWPSSLPPLMSRESRAGFNWVTLGFQGFDPTDDLRGTGRFGIIAFHSFVLNHPSRAAQIVVESRSPDIHMDMITTPWYPAALASIHVCAFIARLCATGQLRMWLFFSLAPVDRNSSVPEDKKDGNTREVESCWKLVLDLHSYILFEFHNYWKADVKRRTVKTVMDFEKCFARFCAKLTAMLVMTRPAPFELDNYNFAYASRVHEDWIDWDVACPDDGAVDAYYPGGGKSSRSMRLGKEDEYIVRPVPIGKGGFSGYFSLAAHDDDIFAEDDEDDEVYHSAATYSSAEEDEGRSSALEAFELKNLSRKAEMKAKAKAA
ncbi:ELMO/CED-12 family-domain-containing protein [Myxozyma melibiosi]|uniref:ELMO/CED-12 family-domain-containing protein n=1 Tax=Myxozyma melibiosi TaxID=54550 RepID=A0ABR1F8P0_9ASCO